MKNKEIIEIIPPFLNKQIFNYDFTNKTNLFISDYKNNFSNEIVINDFSIIKFKMTCINDSNVFNDYMFKDKAIYNKNEKLFDVDSNYVFVDIIKYKNYFFVMINENKLKIQNFKNLIINHNHNIIDFYLEIKSENFCNNLNFKNANSYLINMKKDCELLIGKKEIEEQTIKCSKDLKCSKDIKCGEKIKNLNINIFNCIEIKNNKIKLYINGKIFDKEIEISDSEKILLSFDDIILRIYLLKDTEISQINVILPNVYERMLNDIFLYKNIKSVEGYYEIFNNKKNAIKILSPIINLNEKMLITDNDFEEIDNESNIINTEKICLNSVLFK